MARLATRVVKARRRLITDLHSHPSISVNRENTCWSCLRSRLRKSRLRAQAVANVNDRRYPSQRHASATCLHLASSVQPSYYVLLLSSRASRRALRSVDVSAEKCRTESKVNLRVRFRLLENYSQSLRRCRWAAMVYLSSVGLWRARVLPSIICRRPTVGNIYLPGGGS